eukprot:gene8795-9735_t
MLVILCNGVTLGMYDPYDEKCQTKQCRTLEIVETIIYAFFVFEMFTKLLAMGLRGSLGYFGDAWNRLDFFIVLASTFEYLYGDGEYLSSIRAARVLRPLRAINKVPSIRILVALLLDTLPMLGNVLAICTLIFVVFGIIGVQLWQGVLRNRCALHLPANVTNTNLSAYYLDGNKDFSLMCSLPNDHGMAHCNSKFISNYSASKHSAVCKESYKPNQNLSNTSCINWNMYYTKCEQVGGNPYYGAISFDHAGLAFIAIFQVITLEGWSQIMYFLQDSYSQWVWIYFVALIVVGAYFMTNLCLVVIATQFSETRQRESALIEQANKRARLLKSYSTLSGSLNGDQDQGCYSAILEIIVSKYKRIRKVLRRRFAGTRCCKVEEKKRKKRKRKIAKKKSKQSVTSTIHLHHHHHHHFHHHHHICGHHNQHCTPACADYSPNILETTGRSLPTPTILAIENVKSEQPTVPGVASVGPLTAIQSTALLIPDATVVICRPTSAKSLQPTHTVSFISTPMSDKSSFHDDNSIKASSTAAVREYSTGRRKANSATNCPSVEQFEADPEKLTEALNIFNYIFTAIFAIEFLLKLYSYGLYGYLKDSFNLFDGTIVIVSTVEIFGSSESGVSVLRTFRLMRIFKLIRFLPSLQKQVTVMVKTLDSVVTFLALLIVFIFTVSILGMHLFGAKIQFNGIPVRHNFDSLLWALMTTFQVLTQEEWNIVMYDAMRATTQWAALYFIILMTIGNYILFNLLVAILVEGFSNDPKLRALLKPNSKPQQITDKPQQSNDEDLTIKENGTGDQNCNEPCRKSAYEKDSFHGENNYSACDDARCQARRSLVKSISDVGQVMACQKLAAWSPKTKGNSWPSLVAKCRDETCDCCMREGRVRCDSDTTLKDNGSRKRIEGKPLLQTNEDNVPVFTEEFPTNEEKQQAEKQAKTAPSWFEAHCCNCFQTRREYSLYLLAPNNWFRRLNSKLIANKWFDRIILFFIFFNCVVLAMERPGLHPESTERKFIDLTNNIFTGVFILEMTIKIFAMGFTIGPNTYLKSGWNVMDCFLVVISIIDILVTRFSDTKSSILGVLKVFRALRTLRPLRVISRAPGLKLVVETLLSSLKPIGNLLVIAGVFFTIFGILGVQIFKGRFFYCLNPTGPVTTKAECLLKDGQWRNRQYNFDNLLKAMLTLFVFSTKDGWVALMYHGIDAVGVDKEPIKNHNPWAFLYFFSFLLIAGFVVINMVVGVIIDNFHRCRIEIEAIDGIQKHVTTKQEHILDGVGDESSGSRLTDPNFLQTSNESLYKGDNDDRQETDSLSDDGRNSSINDSLFDTFPLWRRLLYTVVTHYKFDIMIATVIGLNVLFMAIEYYKMPYELMQFLKISNYVFTGIFILEAAMKMLAFGIRTFFSERWNQLDVIIVILSIIGIVLEELNESLPINPTIIRIMRVLRITRVLKILRSADGIQKLLNCLAEALPQVGNLSMLFLLLFFIFSSLGMELFGKLDCSRDVCNGLNRHANFQDFGHAMLTLFRISTGDSWSGIMRDTLNTKICTQDCAMLYWVTPIYFAFFVLSTQFVLVNVVVAVLMKQLEDSKDDGSTSSSRGLSDLSDEYAREESDRQLEGEEDNRCFEGEEDNRCFEGEDDNKQFDNEEDNRQLQEKDVERRFRNEKDDKVNSKTSNNGGKLSGNCKSGAEQDYEDNSLQRGSEICFDGMAYSRDCRERSDTFVKQETQETLVENENPSEQRINNTVIVVSPSHDMKNQTNSSKQDPFCRNSLQAAARVNDSYQDNPEHCKEIEQTDDKNCRSMPDISLHIPHHVDKAFDDTSLSMTCLNQTIPQVSSNANAFSLMRTHKSDHELALFSRRRSSCKVAPIQETSINMVAIINHPKQDSPRLTISSISAESHSEDNRANRDVHL